jgi:phenylpropionate dioxygenase-like ring-hydroxylating dioxygenase large terminal subunit
VTITPQHNARLVQDLLEEDIGPAAPAPLRERSQRSFDLDDIPIARYTSKRYLEREYERLWSRVWQWACCEEDIPNVGDFTIYEVGDRSVIVSRSAPNTITAFHNACLHRGRQLKERPGSCQRIVCPFHMWSYNLDGSLHQVHAGWDFPQVPDDARLREIRVERWAGFVFINFDQDAAPLTDFLDVLPAHFEHFLPLDRRYTLANISKVMPCNWKVAVEAFLESYHSVSTHPQILEYNDEANTQYDVWTNVSRLITPFGVSSPHYGGESEPEDILEAALSFVGGTEDGGPDPFGDALRANGGATLQPGETPRQALASRMRGAFRSLFDADVSAVSDSEMVDAISYLLFPNWMPWASVGIGLLYRFRPNGNDPDTSIFDLRLTAPIPDSGERPAAPPVRHLGPDETFASVPELFALGLGFDQDYSNLQWVQRGMKASGEQGLMMGDYQESRIRHFHALLEAWMKD